jgi:two-component system, sensor histidine kinase and response regulator
MQVRCELPNDMVFCDRERVLQVFANLLGNAIKFCRSGAEISVTARRSGNAQEISVADSGPGIGSEDLPFVFDPYWSGTHNRLKGTGLGLYITKSIVEAHGTQIWIESERGRGTTVRFTLPLATGE